MNYRQDMEKSIKYIEAHLSKTLTAQMIADHVGYSLYHYCRIFLACYGMPVMGYVRKRRLSLATRDLAEGKKVVDVALKYGFETPSGFSKAFRKEFDFSPTMLTKSTEQLKMKPVMIKKTSFKVAGYAIETKISDANSTKDMAAFWDQFNINGWENKLYAQLNPPKHGEIGIFIPGDGDCVSYVLGVIVENFESITADMVCIDIPEADYAVFSTKPVNMRLNEADFANSIKNMWKKIFEEWLSESDYVYDQEKLDFEYYDERCHFREDSIMEIYIPVRHK